MAVIAQRQRLRRLSGSGTKRAKWSSHSAGVELAQADALRPALVPVAQGMLREASGSDGIEEGVAERRMDGHGLVVGGNGHRFGCRTSLST